ncbi:MAG: hypothetical protein FGM41_09390, partial [Bacteroidetes bacterium]|nr:hypothetical protein [Bacteroidota bacterium]
MKKLLTSKAYKDQNQRHAKWSLKQRSKFKEFKRKKNKSELGKGISERKYKRKFEDRYRNYRKVNAPEVFSFIENPLGVVKFISTLKYNFDKQKKVFVVLRHVKIISYDAIVVLLSIMVRFKAKNIKFDGDFPENKSAKQVLLESQFLTYLGQKFKDEERYNLGQKSSIHTHAWKDVDSELGDLLIKEASKTVWGDVRRCQGVQRTLIELMLNTNNHADDTKKCSYCGSPNYGKGCKMNPFSDLHLHGIPYNSMIKETLNQIIKKKMLLTDLTKPIE